MTNKHYLGAVLLLIASGLHKANQLNWPALVESMPTTNQRKAWWRFSAKLLRKLVRQINEKHKQMIIDFAEKLESMEITSDMIEAAFNTISPMVKETEQFFGHGISTHAAYKAIALIIYEVESYNLASGFYSNLSEAKRKEVILYVVQVELDWFDIQTPITESMSGYVSITNVFASIGVLLKEAIEESVQESTGTSYVGG